MIVDTVNRRLGMLLLMLLLDHVLHDRHHLLRAKKYAINADTRAQIRGQIGACLI